MLFHSDVALDEHLDALNPLRHLMHQTDSETDNVASFTIPNQSRSIQNQVLHLAFHHPQNSVSISLTVDSKPGCGGIAWLAGEILSSYLVKRGPSFLDGRTIIEIGSGTGLVGLVAGKLANRSAHAWITDQAPLLDIMRRNVYNNGLNPDVTVAELNWGDPLPSDIPPADLILAADCVYLEPTFPLLVKTLCDLVDLGQKQGKETEVLFCYKKRRRADKRFFALLRKSFSWAEVIDDPDRDAYNRETIILLRLFRRRNSSTRPNQG